MGIREGTTVNYTEKLKDPRWQRKRSLILQRDRYLCRECRRPARSLDVHHFHYVRGEPWDVEDHFLITLCRECHKDRQDIDDRAKEALALILSQCDLAGATHLADELSARASDATRGLRMEMSPSGWLDEERWIGYAEEYPKHRTFVEMVLGRIMRWRHPPDA